MSEGLSQNDYAEAIVMEYVRTKKSDLRDKIVAAYRDLVQRAARKYAGLELYDDLVQVGYTGLLNALNLYEPSKGVRFNTYATHLVTGAIKHYLRDRARIIREPAWLQEVRHKVNRAAAQLQQECGDSPTPQAIAKKTGVPKETVQEVLATDDLFKVASLSSHNASDDDDHENPEFADDDRDQISVEDRVVLERAFAELREVEQKALYLFHFESLNQTEIAAQLGISGNYVSHILRQSLSKLRQKLAEEERNDLRLREHSDNLLHEIIDPQTGVYTETHTRSMLDESCSRAACDHSSVGFLRLEFTGLDTFGSFYGQAAVSTFLADAAMFLRQNVRRLDLIGRMGQSGFGIIVPGAGKNVEVVMENLRGKLRAWMTRSNLANTGLAVLIGEAWYPESGKNAAALLKAASLRAIEKDEAA